MSRDYRAYAIETFGAVEQPDGSWLHEGGNRVWYNDEGGYHREDGPAIIYANRDQFGWSLNSDYHTFESWCIKLNKSDEAKFLLKLQYV
jgi:hypothetical protein